MSEGKRAKLEEGILEKGRIGQTLKSKEDLYREAVTRDLRMLMDRDRMAYAGIAVSLFLNAFVLILLIMTWQGVFE